MPTSTSNAVSTEVLSLPERALTRMQFAFSPQDDMWVIPDASHSGYFNFATLKPFCSDELIGYLKKTLIWYLREKSTNHSYNMFKQFKQFAIESVSNGVRLSEITANQIMSYRGNLPTENEWYLGALSGLFKKWHDLGYPGIAYDAYALLHEMRITGNRKGYAVLTNDPEEGPFMEIELQAINGALHEGFATGKIGNREFALAGLFMSTGSRPVQVASLKVKDLKEGRDETGNIIYIIDMPRAKQRNALRRGLLKSRPLKREFGEVLVTWANQIQYTYAEEISDGIPLEDLPLFPIWNKNNPPGFEHHSSGDKLNNEIKKIFSLLEVQSYRTNAPMRITPTRFRYTFGTRLGMERKSIYVIAENLDHTDTQNAGVYLKAVAEIIGQLDEALAKDLAPYAAAFAGKIIEKGSEEGLNCNPASLVRYPKVDPEKGGVGNCGGCGDCGAMVPVACYVCYNFKAWDDGPHEEVLRDLVEERRRILEETGDERIANANDHVILAVAQVIGLCSKMEEEAI